MNARRAALLVVLLVALGSTSACDTSVEAFEETDLTYSIFGYLDARADTQFVRVEPLRDSMLVGSGSLEARVTSTNLETGETTVWRDSIFDLTGGGTFAHNFYTTNDLEPEATYRFTATSLNEGGASTAEVTLPSAFPSPQVTAPPELSTPEREITVVLVDGVEQLGAALATYRYEICSIATPPQCLVRHSSFSHLQDTTRQSDGTYEVAIDWMADINQSIARETYELNELYSFTVTVASVSEDWPEYAEESFPRRDSTEQVLPPPGINSNIESGVGFLGGAFTRTVNVPIFQ